MRKLCMCFSGGSFCFALLFVYTHMHTFLGTLIYTHTQSWFDWYRKNLVRSHDYEMEFSWLFFHCFFLCFVFLCSLFFLALLNAVRCCYLLVILVLLLLFRLLHTFTSSSVYRTKVALSGLFYCGLPWSLSLSFFIEIWLIWQALVVNVDLALCARCTFIDFLFILGIFFINSFAGPCAKWSMRGEREKRCCKAVSNFCCHWTSSSSSSCCWCPLPLFNFAAYHRKMLISWQTYVRSFFALESSFCCCVCFFRRWHWTLFAGFFTLLL